MSTTLDPSLAGLNDCGCCEGLTVQTPAVVENRPGLAAIAYRVGTHDQFKPSMLARLSSADYPALAGLQTRDDDDFSIALLDAWATVADVLTFYQERIASEAYLRTATERRSLVELARLIGYRPRPGLAASTHLAFSLEDAPGAPGEATIEIGTRVQSLPGPGEQPQIFETVEAIEARAEWNAIKPRPTLPQILTASTDRLYLEGLSTQLQTGDTIILVGAEREANPTGSAWINWFALTLDSVTTEPEANRTVVTWGGTLAEAGPLGPAILASVPTTTFKVYALRQRAALFGHNAPDPRLLDVPAELATGTPLQWVSFSIPADHVDLDASYPKIVNDGWLLLRNTPWNFRMLLRATSVGFPSRSDYTVSAKVTRIVSDLPEVPFIFGPVPLGAFFPLRDSDALAQSEALTLAEAPLETPVQNYAVFCTGALGDLPTGRLLAISGLDATSGEARAEVVALAGTLPVGDSTILVFASALQHVYRRDSVTISANVASATHGETKQEVLGGGDASQAFQRFALRQPPLTYVSSPIDPGGTQSTLEVRVNRVLWHEVESFYGRGPRERVYLTRIDDDGTTSVQFGDGQNGARPSTGRENVEAKYRKGLGQAGNVKAGQLSLLLTRPLGVRGVGNPTAALGGDDPETLDSLRANGPLGVLTLGRIVSLRDYEDFARAFGGIGKALATWTWDGQVRGVFLTVAGPNGDPVPEGSMTHTNLLTAIQRSGDPTIPVRLQTYQPATFRLVARIKVAPDYLQVDVFAAVDQALRAAFSFEARAFGQPVHLSEVMAVIQAVPGVLGVDLEALYLGTTATLSARLDAAAPLPGGPAGVAAAELLTLHPDPINLTVLP